MITVRDYVSSEDRWIVWQASTLQLAYTEYPFQSPAVADLAGRVHITYDARDIAAAGTVSAHPQSVWRVENDTDFIPGFRLAGHTGLWAIEIHEPAPDEASVRGLFVENDSDLSPDDGQRALFTLDLIDIYPLSDGLPDTFWLSNNNDIVLNP